MRNQNSNNNLNAILLTLPFECVIIINNHKILLIYRRLIIQYAENVTRFAACIFYLLKFAYYLDCSRCYILLNNVGWHNTMLLVKII